MFFTKKKKIVLEAYAPSGSLIDLFPITRSSDALPHWYEKLPAKVNGDKTVKHCPGLKDLYNTGIMIPSWSDFEMAIAPDDSGYIKSGMNKKYGIPAEGHDLSIQAPAAWPGYVSVKLINPWLFWCSEPIDWLWVQPSWSQLDPQELTLIPAITEFRYQYQANINTIIKQPTQTKIIKITGGTPLAHLVPLTERDWELKLDVMTPEIYAKKFERWDFSLSQNTGYNKIRSVINRKNKQLCKY